MADVTGAERIGHTWIADSTDLPLPLDDVADSEVEFETAGWEWT